MPPFHDSNDPNGVLPETMRPEKFAAHVDVSYRTVQRYIQQGMPAIGRPRHAKFIPVVRALAWLADGGKSRRGRPRNIDRGRAAPRTP